MGSFESFLNKVMMSMGGGGEEPKKKGAKYSSQEQITKDNEWLRNFLARQGAPQYLVSNSVVARGVGDPVPQFEVYGTPPQTPANRRTVLPSGVRVDDIINDRGNYGYIDPVYGSFVAVDPQAIFQKYGKPK